MLVRTYRPLKCRNWGPLNSTFASSAVAYASAATTFRSALASLQDSRVQRRCQYWVERSGMSRRQSQSDGDDLGAADIVLAEKV